MKRFWIGLVVACAVVSTGIVLAGEGHATQADKKAKAPVIHVQSLDPDFDPTALKAPGIVVHQAGELKAVDTVPPPEERDATFRKAGLMESVAKLDALDRDMLYDRARRLKLEELKAKYPEIDSKRLAKLQKLIREKKKR
jgi:hypothetical protein